MTKEQLIALGLGEELAIKVAGESKKELEGYVERAKYLELETEKNQLAESNKSLIKNLEEVKKNVGDNEELKKQISDMQETQKAKDKEYAENIAKIRLDNALDIALMSAGAKNNKAVKALLNLDGAKIGEDGKVVGLDEQLKVLKAAADSSFLFEVIQTPKGGSPAGNPEKKVNFNEMTYSQMEKYLAENPGAKID
ncbi:phage scaffolding protein [Fusobacterium mortiferum]|uniref:phage scaffolding protein n=1 Tax=Fusobacterium mortiferum TaxID=850 RepID=UPI00195C46ED|nr:phage scaffolding protein [Fusobacterium mortiferum]